MSSNEAKVPSCNDWVTRMCQMMCDTIVIHYLKISDHISDRVGFLISGHILLENSLGANFSNGCVNYGFWIWHVATDANSWMIRVTRLTYNCAHLRSTKESRTIWIFWVKIFWVKIFWVNFFLGEYTPPSVKICFLLWK